MLAMHNPASSRGLVNFGRNRLALAERGGKNVEERKHVSTKMLLPPRGRTWQQKRGFQKKEMLGLNHAEMSLKRNKKLMIDFGVLLCQKMKIQKDLLIFKMMFQYQILNLRYVKATDQ